MTGQEVAGLLLVWILVIWIPIGVYRGWEVFDRTWKRGTWISVSWIPLINQVLVFPVFLATMVWKGTAASVPPWRKWMWRAAACTPVLSAVALPVFMRKERLDRSGTPLPFHRLRGVAYFSSAVTLVGFGLILFGRAPAVSVESEHRISESLDRYTREERRFLTGSESTRPEVCVSLSGGGIRSAAFSLGVLHGLHDLGILRDVDVISAVSGGTYALSWLMLQPAYHGAAAGVDLSAMFSDDGRFQSYLRENSSFVETAAVGWRALYGMTFPQLLRPIVRLLGAGEIGTETQKLYAWQIQRTFHGHPTQGADGRIVAANVVILPPEIESLPTSLWVVRNVEFQGGLRNVLKRAGTESTGSLPYPIFNVALSASVDERHKGTIWPYHFELTPLGLGGPALGYVGWDRVQGDEFRAIRSVNIAPAISGAAISGYAQAGSALQRAGIRLFNLDLGYSVRNFYGPGPRSIYLSDGGHSENLGLYALLQRQCGTVIAADAEHEEYATGGIAPRYEFSSYDKLVGAALKENLADITLKTGDPERTFDASQPVLEGEIAHEGGLRASLIYLKLALDRAKLADFPAPVRSYATDAHPRFPHDPTTSQEYVPDQFKAYESLGRHMACTAPALQRLSRNRCDVPASPAIPQSTRR